jgi:hypothetical protein
VGIEESVEVLLRFAGKGFELGGEAVFEGVLGGSGLAFGSDGSFGFSAVGAGGVGFGLRCHANGIARRGKGFSRSGREVDDFVGVGGEWWVVMGWPSITSNTPFIEAILA